MPKVSVIIPTYNRAEFLRSAIKSVLGQTFQDFEIIVVDDASTDNTSELIDGFIDKRIKYIRHGINKGPSAARNTGIKASSSDYIAFLDDDDEWLPEKLKKQIDLLENSPTNVGGVYTGSLCIDRATGKILEISVPKKGGRLFKEFLNGNIFMTPSLLVRREGFKNVGLFDESIPFGEDWDMWIRISEEYNFEYIQEPLVKIYVHKNKLSTNLEAIIKGWEVIRKKHSQAFALNKKAYSYFHLLLGVTYCYNKNTTKGREAFLTSIKLYPFDVRPYFNLIISLLGAGAFRKIKEIKEKGISSVTRSAIQSN